MHLTSNAHIKVPNSINESLLIVIVLMSEIHQEICRAVRAVIKYVMFRPNVSVDSTSLCNEYGWQWYFKASNIMN